MKKQFFLWALLLFCTIPTLAYDFKVGGIYYNKLGGDEIEVTYGSYKSYKYNVKGEYYGSVTIPETVFYNNTTYRVIFIGENAFHNCSSLTAITIPNSVTFIDEDAFFGCSSLIKVNYTGTIYSWCNILFSDNPLHYGADFYLSDVKVVDLVLPDWFTTIDTWFRGCTSIQSLTIPNSVTTIGHNTFSGCSSLAEITIPESITSIGANAFSGCTSIQSLTIPESITSIGANAFSGCTSIQSLTIPNSITTIGDYAFSGCSSLTAITIPESITSIGDNAFSGCSTLNTIIWNAKNCTNFSADYLNNSNAPFYSIRSQITSFTFGNEVEHIPAHLCHGMSNLTSITIPESVTTIGEEAFLSAFISKTNYTGDIASWCAIKFADYSANPIDASNNLYLNDIEVKELIIPNDVTHIGDYAFCGCSGLISITIPENVTSIGDYAFNGCFGLISITIPENVTSIGKYAFQNCSGLTSITWDAKNCSIAYESSYNYSTGKYSYTYYLPFNDCSSITSFTFGDAVESIPTRLCCYMQNLTSITIPKNVTYIGERVWYSCDRLTSVTWNAKSYKDFSSTSTPFRGYDYDLRSQITSFTFGNEVEHIPAYLCSGMKNINEITIPSSVTTIGEYAFDGCSSLQSVIWNAKHCKDFDDRYTRPFTASSITSFTFCDEIEHIPAYICYDLDGLTSITIPNSVTKIGNCAFSWCNNLKKINYIGDIASWCAINFGDDVPLPFSYDFYINDVEVKDIIIPNDITFIGNGTFFGCSGLTSITISNGVTSIGNSAFSYCSGLTSITIPNGVTSIGNSAFSNCSGLTSITIPNSVTSIGNSAFSNCSGLTSITIPNGVTSIGNSAFSYCSGLTSITIPNSVTSIGNHVFDNCSGLTSITIPNSVTSIGNSAFYDCSGLTSITIPNSVTSIGEYTFYRCSNISSLTLGLSVNTIGKGAFAGCTSITYITSLSSIAPIGVNTKRTNTGVITESGSFCDVPTGAEVAVPCGAAPNYRVAPGWTEFTHITENFIYEFKVSVKDETTGLVQTLQSPTCDLPAIIKAIPMDGYKFQTWSDGNTLSMRQIEVTEDIDLQALFVPIDGSGNVTDVTVTPTDSTAAFTWPTVEGAASYTLIIWADENETERICTLTFDAAGRLTNLDFSKRNAPAKTTAAGFGLNFTVTGLDAGTKYGYSLDSKTSDGVILNSKSGTFETIGATGIEDIFTPAASDSARKVLENGTIYILRNGEKYTIDGRKMK